MTEQTERELIAQLLEDAAYEIWAAEDDDKALRAIERVGRALTVYAEAERKQSKAADFAERQRSIALDKLRRRPETEFSRHLAAKKAAEATA